MRNGNSWQTAGDSPETRSDGFNGQMQKYNGRRSTKRDQDGARDFPRISQAENHHGNRKYGYGSCRHRERIPRPPKGHHAVKEIAGHVIHLQSKKIANLRAGNQNGDAIGEANDDRPGKVFHHGSHAGHAEQDQKNARHHCADEQPVDAVLGDNARYDHHERARRPADLRFRAAQRRDQEARNNGAVQPRLRGHSRSDRKRHRQGKRHEANSHAGD